MHVGTAFDWTWLWNGREPFHVSAFCSSLFGFVSTDEPSRRTVRTVITRHDDDTSTYPLREDWLKTTWVKRKGGASWMRWRSLCDSSVREKGSRFFFLTFFEPSSCSICTESLPSIPFYIKGRRRGEKKKGATKTKKQSSKAWPQTRSSFSLLSSSSSFFFFFFFCLSRYDTTYAIRFGVGLGALRLLFSSFLPVGTTTTFCTFWLNEWMNECVANGHFLVWRKCNYNLQLQLHDTNSEYSACWMKRSLCILL